MLFKRKKKLYKFRDELEKTVCALRFENYTLKCEQQPFSFEEAETLKNLVDHAIYDTNLKAMSFYDLEALRQKMNAYLDSIV